MLALCRNVNRLRKRRESLAWLLAFCASAFLLCPVEAFSFLVPETLVYDLTWTGVKAGEASLEVKNGGNGLVITSKARSAKWVSIFYTVNNRVESRLSKSATKKDIGQPVYYRIDLREGKNRRKKEVTFDRENLKALYIDFLNYEKKEFQLPSLVFDPLSSFYYLRMLNLEVGKSVYVTVFDSKKVWDVEVQVLRKERIEVPAGEFQTIVVKPLMKSEGVFYPKGEIVIWLTDDKKRVPVKLKTKVKIGSVTAQLAGGTY